MEKERWIWILIVIITTVIYLLIFRQFTISKNWWLLLPVIILGAIAFYGYYLLFSAGSIGMTYGIITGSIVALLAIGGLIFFKEKIKIGGVIGLGLIIGGVLLLATSN